jgi:creatinine amidohydrolase
VSTRSLGELSWVDVHQVAQAMPLVVLPIGAVEQHGPHLPLLVDSIVVEAIAAEVSVRTGVAVAPTFSYSSSQGHSSVFPGTLALSPRTTERALAEISRWLVNAGFTRLFLLNGHLGNTGVLWNAVDNLIAELSPRVSIAGHSWWDVDSELWSQVTADVPGSRGEFHANLAETALMLHLRPDLVRMDRAVDQPEAAWAFAYDMSRKSESGAIGRSITQATPELGRHLFEQAVAAVTALVHRMLAEAPPAAPAGDIGDWRDTAVRRITSQEEG